jgi:DNA modification methylase
MTKKKPTKLQVEEWPIDRPIPYARNPRKISEAAVAAVAGSIREFGFRSPIIVDGQGTVINGHTRLMAARQLGLTTVPVVIAADLTPAQCQAYRLADNRVAEFSEWDGELLRIELDDCEVDLAFAEFGELLKDLPSDESETMDQGDPDEVPSEAAGDPASQRGEVYELGPHRLMCGDSTSAEDWQAILGDEIGDAVMTDPPYGIDYVGGCSDPRSPDYKKGDRVENDGEEGLSALLHGALGQVLSRSKPGAVWYVAAPAGRPHVEFSMWLLKEDILRQVLIWNKDQMVFGRSDYHYKHEFIYYGWKPGAAHRAPPDRTQVSVWDIKRPRKSEDHPTMKPVELYERMMNNSTAPGELILEPFGGSGTTLIAAAKTGRICRAMEIAPRYCDVIRRRWTKFARENGKDPGTGALD